MSYRRRLSGILACLAISVTALSAQTGPAAGQEAIRHTLVIEPQRVRLYRIAA